MEQESSLTHPLTQSWNMGLWVLFTKTVGQKIWIVGWKVGQQVSHNLEAVVLMGHHTELSGDCVEAHSSEAQKSDVGQGHRCQSHLRVMIFDAREHRR